MMTSQPSPYGSSLASAGLLTRSSLTATSSPAAADFAGPTHLPDSTVAQDLPASTFRPGFFGVNATSCQAIAVATVVMPSLTLSSSCSLNQMCFSTSYRRSSGKWHPRTSGMGAPEVVSVATILGGAAARHNRT